LSNIKSPASRAKRNRSRYGATRQFGSRHSGRLSARLGGSALRSRMQRPFDFFDCFSKQAHLGRPGRANPLDPSADQGSVDRQIMGGNPAFRGTRVPVHLLAELCPRACARPRATEGKCSLICPRREALESVLKDL